MSELWYAMCSGIENIMFGANIPLRDSYVPTFPFRTKVLSFNPSDNCMYYDKDINNVIG